MLFSLKAATVVALATTTLADKRDDCNDNTAPVQVRLAYAGDRGMSVSWNTKQKLSKPTVYFGTGSDLDGSASSDVSITYPTSSTYNNHVTIAGLHPDTRYHYMPQCGNRVYSFTTARSVGKGEEFKFAMVGDLGTMGPDGLSTTVGTGAKNPLKPGEKTTIDSLHSLKTSYDFVWHGLPLSLDIVFIS
jgi:acid phosphatase type 7